MIGRIPKLLTLPILALLLLPASARQADAFWGAVALSQSTGAYGISNNAINQTAARNAALALCFNTGAGDCRIQTLYRGCAAIASDVGANAYGIGLANTARQASRNAVIRCNRHAGGGCYAQGVRCNN